MSMARPVRLPKRTKYRAIRTVVDGISFASKKEARRYSELKLMELADEIQELIRQPRFPIDVIVNSVGDTEHICDYVADFSYWRNDKRIVEDTKGFRTPEYRLKKKLVQALYGIEIFET